MLVQHLRPFHHIYPLPLTAMGVRADLPFEQRAVMAHSRCETRVICEIIKLDNLDGRRIDLMFEVVSGGCEHRSLRLGQRIAVGLDLVDVHHPDAESLLHLVMATGVSLDRIETLEEIMHRPFFVSVAMPCEFDS